MKKITTRKTMLLEEFRDPEKALSKIGDSPVAVLNQKTVVGYFVPKAAVDLVEIEASSPDEIHQALRDSKKSSQPVLDYLKEK